MLVALIIILIILGIVGVTFKWIARLLTEAADVKAAHEANKAAKPPRTVTPGFEHALDRPEDTTPGSTPE